MKKSLLLLIAATTLAGCASNSYERTETDPQTGITRKTKFGRTTVFTSQVITGIDVQSNAQTGQQSLKVTGVQMTAEAAQAAAIVDSAVSAAIRAKTP